MTKEKTENLRSINVENEHKVLAYCMRNLGEISLIEKTHFLHPINQALASALNSLNEKHLEFTKEDLLTFAREVNPSINIELIKQIHDKFESFPNIERAKEVLINDYYKTKVSKKIIEDLLTETTKKDYVPSEKFREIGLELLNSPIAIRDTDILLPTSEIAKRHQAIIQERILGKKDHSVGIRLLDALITKPGAAQEISYILGLKGSGKTALILNMINNLINRNVCVLFVSLDMSMESIIDRWICIRENLSIKELVRKDMNPEIQEKVKLAQERLSKLDNFLLVNRRSLDLNLLEVLIVRAREMFRKRGCLPDDGYFVLAIDHTSLLDDFEGDELKLVNKAVRKLHVMTGEHNIHTIGLIQANENKFRTGRVFKKPEDLDNYRFGLEDIYGSGAYANSGRVVMSINRPLHLKKMFFLGEEYKEMFESEIDYLHLNIVKQNDGPLGSLKLLFDDNFRIVPYVSSTN